MRLLQAPISKETLEELKIKEILDAVAYPNYAHYMEAFEERVKLETDERRKAAFKFLASICSLRLVPSNIDEPYVPLIIMQNTRSTSLDDFDENDLETLKHLLTIETAADLKARAADILWLKLKPRDPQYALIAINSYLDTSSKFGTEIYETYILQLIARALSIAISLGKGNPSISTTVTRIESLVDQYGGKDPIIIGVHLLEMLISRNCINPTKHLPLLEQYARLAKDEKKQLIELHCWELYAKISNMQNNDAGRERAYVEMGESHIIEAESSIADGRGYIGATHFMDRAIEAFRRAGHQGERIKELRNRLLEYQSHIPSEMKTVETQFDVRELADRGEKIVSGFSFHDAIKRLASIDAISTMKELEEQVKDLANNYPLQYLFSGTGVDRQGRTIIRKISPFTADPKELDAAMKAEMWSQARFDQHFAYQSYIQYARMKIIAEHHVELKDMVFIVANNPFIPEDRKILYARGLLAGLQGDFMVAGHLLIPQLENSIRYLLSQNGIETTTYDSQGIQLEKSLNDLFDKEYAAVVNIFGEDMTFLLQGLLVERYGSNFRNSIAHGLLEDASFYSSNIGYLWWLTLRLCCVEHINAYYKELMESEKKPSAS